MIRHHVSTKTTVGAYKMERNLPLHRGQKIQALRQSFAHAANRYNGVPHSRVRTSCAGDAKIRQTPRPNRGTTVH